MCSIRKGYIYTTKSCMKTLAVTGLGMCIFFDRCQKFSHHVGRACCIPSFSPWNDKGSVRIPEHRYITAWKFYWHHNGKHYENEFFVAHCAQTLILWTPLVTGYRVHIQNYTTVMSWTNNISQMVNDLFYGR